MGAMSDYRRIKQKIVQLYDIMIGDAPTRERVARGREGAFALPYFQCDFARKTT